VLLPRRGRHGSARTVVHRHGAGARRGGGGVGRAGDPAVRPGGRGPGAGGGGGRSGRGSARRCRRRAGVAPPPAPGRATTGGCARRGRARDRRRRAMTYPAAMTSMRRWVPLVAAVAMVVAACGSDGAADSDTRDRDRAGAAEQAEPTTTTTSAEATTTAAAAEACDFRADPPAAREVDEPDADPAEEGLVTVVLHTADGQIPMELDRAAAPCNVENLVSLAGQDYFDDTECHRLTTQGIFVLQCGDPTGTGTGGPGYTVPDEFPKDLPDFEGPDGPVAGATVYPRGSIAIANTGAPH